jgi:hypothetical protein
MTEPAKNLGLADLANHCAMCGGRHEILVSRWPQVPNREWCGDERGAEDWPELLCGCSGRRK